MKALLRILVLLAILLVGFFYVNQSGKENETLKGPTKTLPNTEVPKLDGDVMERPTKGWSTFVGKKISTIKEKLGDPIRKGPSSYGFEWWVYKDEAQYILVGVEKEKINQVYITGTDVDLAPFKLGQTIDELYRNTITDTEINVRVDDSIYTMILSEEDLQSRLLVMYKDVLAQLYFDHTTKKLVAIRFIEGESLVKQKPYDMTYVGDVVEPKKPSSFEQEKINEENAQQLFELSNIARQQNDLPALEENAALSALTQQQLQSIIMENVSKVDATFKDLDDLLEQNNIEFKDNAENIAEDYSDTPDAISGVINSEKHRKDLLNKKYTILGTGAFENNFSQIFVEQKKKNNE